MYGNAYILLEDQVRARTKSVQSSPHQNPRHFHLTAKLVSIPLTYQAYDETQAVNVNEVPYGRRWNNRRY